MSDFAPRIPPRLLDAIERLARNQVPIAAINRLVGSRAEQMGLPRPSYEQVRVLVHAARTIRRAQAPRSETVKRAAQRTFMTSEEIYSLLEKRAHLRDRASPNK